MNESHSTFDDVETLNQRVQRTTEAARAYAAFTVTTARYPTEIQQLAGNVTAAILYTSIGIGNEVGELAELFTPTHLLTHDKDRFAEAWKELGDVQWYVARMCAESDRLPRFDLMVMRAMQRLRDGLHWANPRLTGRDLSILLCIQSGRVLGVVKKMMRDGATWDDNKVASKTAELTEALQEIVNLSAEYAEESGARLDFQGGYSALLESNRDKLSGRLERGTLQGDGDVR